MTTLDLPQKYDLDWDVKVNATLTLLRDVADSKQTSAQVSALITSAINDLVAGAPAALDTLDELAAALGDNANYAASIVTALGLKAPSASPTFTGTVSGVTKAHVGLGSVDNTSDLAKPVSAAQKASMRPFALTTGQETLQRIQISVQTLVTATGNLRLTYFAATKSETISKVKFASGSTAAAATPTLVRVGIYSVNVSTGDLTLIGSTVNDTSLLATVSTFYTKALSAGVALTEGTVYAVGLLVVTAAAAPFVAGHNIPVPQSQIGLAPRMAGNLTGQTDLPANITQAALADTTQLMYFALIP